MTTIHNNFKPTPEMIGAAETVFLAMTMAQHVRPIVRAYETTILQEAQWHIARKWVDCERGLPDQVILDPKNAYLLDEPDFAVFIAKCHEARKAAGLKVSAEDNCPLLEAEELQRQAERALLMRMEPITKCSVDQVTALGPEKYRQFIDLTLRLLAPFVSNPLAKKGGV